MDIQYLETPALILCKKTLRKNMDAMKELLAGTGVALRPHYKTHKCAAIAHWQMENGAVGMTCAKLSEAEDLADSGIEDILIANQIVDPAKIRRLAELALKCRLTLCVDSADNISALSRAAETAGSTIYCLIEYDIGMERCGVTTGEEVLALARQIASSPNLVFEGLQAYAGHVSHIPDAETRRQMTAQNARRVKGVLALLRENGLEVRTVSGGSTGTAAIKAGEGLYTELQTGSYLFMDATYSLVDSPFENSLFVLSTVVSTREGLAVVDSGVKTCGVDQGMPSPVGFTADPIVASEEHFQLHNPTKELKVGDRVKLIPGHCCSTVNLHEWIYVVEDDRVVDRLPITARKCGK